MATLVAGPDGKLSGKFTIPANIPAGAKMVRAQGMGGKVAIATFTGRGNVITEERRRVTTTVTTIVQTLNINGGGGDPLAQTFTLSQSRHIAGVDLWFTAKDSNDVIVQIRETMVGLPNQSVLAEKRVKPAEMIITGTHTRILFDAPVFLDASREFAIVVMTDSAVAAVAVAELGKFDANMQRWITSQPYQVGVLLSSSNAITWTAHQDRDLTFRLLGCRFTSTTRTIPLGSVNVEDASDLIAALSIDIPATGASAQLRTTSPTGEVLQMVPDVNVALNARMNGTVTLEANLTGTAIASPVLYPGVQFIAGDQQDTGSYISRAFPCGTSSRVSVTFEALTPGASTVLVEIQRTDGTWQTVALSNGVQVGDGWVERTHTATGFTATQTRVRLTLTGSAQSRPRVRRLRAVATA